MMSKRVIITYNTHDDILARLDTLHLVTVDIDLFIRAVRIGKQADLRQE